MWPPHPPDCVAQVWGGSGFWLPKAPLITDEAIRAQVDALTKVWYTAQGGACSKRTDNGCFFSRQRGMRSLYRRAWHQGVHIWTSMALINAQPFLVRVCLLTHRPALAAWSIIDTNRKAQQQRQHSSTEECPSEGGSRAAQAQVACTPEEAEASSLEAPPKSGDESGDTSLSPGHTMAHAVEGHEFGEHG